MPQITAKMIAVDPARAEALLKKNTRNRSVSKKTVARYARDMQEGRWRKTGEPIQISNVGRLIDGQHRLHAIIDSGTTQNMLLVQGVPDESFDVLDTGRKRIASDVLGIAGNANASTLGSMLRLILWYEGDHEMKDANPPTYTNSEILERVQNPIQADYLGNLVTYTMGESKKISGVLSRSRFAFCMWLAEQHDETGGRGAREFFDVLVDNTKAESSDHPAVALHRWLVKRRVSGVKAAHRSHWRAEDIAGFCHAWNAWVEDRPLKLIRIRSHQLPKIRVFMGYEDD